jgi:fucose 4-O-acetylase-like acetyltransferase
MGASRTARGRPSARELASATPATRNRYADLVRVVSIGVVVIGHWLMAVLRYEDGEFSGRNLLELDPDLQIVTWVFQVMPLFFIVGGFANATSWSSARRRGVSYGQWLRTRSTRLIRPALWFVSFWTLLPVAGVLLGVLPSGLARVGGEEVSLPMWFLGVYLLSVAAVPPLFAAHERFGGWVLVPLAAGALAVDALRFDLDQTWLGAANFAFVWLAILELGFLRRDGALRRRSWMPWAMATGGLAALAVLVGSFDYPISMIGLTHGVRSNTLPPSAALLVLGVWQCGAMLLFEDAANRWLERHRPWLTVVVASSMLMTLYLWNMTGLVLAAVLLLPTGIAPQPEPLSATWWWLRPAWILVCAICLLPFLFGFRWAERPVGERPPRAGRAEIGLALGGTALAAIGFAVLTTNAFPVPDEVVAAPAIGVACVAAAAALLRVDPTAPLRGPEPAA